MTKKCITITLLGVCFMMLIVAFSTAYADEAIEASNKETQPSEQKRYRKNSLDEDELKARLMDMIPYAEEMKYMWDIADGDVDIYFKGLRFDAGNKGMVYKSNFVPYIGNVSGMEYKLAAGEKPKFSIKSNYMPVIGKIDGMSYKASVKSGDARVFARYTIAFD